MDVSIPASDATAAVQGKEGIGPDLQPLLLLSCTVNGRVLGRRCTAGLRVAEDLRPARGLGTARTPLELRLELFRCAEDEHILWISDHHKVVVVPVGREIRP